MWFVESLKFKNKNAKTKIEIINKKAIILAMLLCYYLRLSSHDKRDELLKRLAPSLENIGFSKNQVEEILLEEENDLLNRMEHFPKGTAKNQALRENIFTLIVCIANKIPLFICGKPGCSKSLAIQLVFKHLKGTRSISFP